MSLALVVLLAGCAKADQLQSQRVEVEGGLLDPPALVFDDGSRIELRIYGQTDDTLCLVLPVSQADIVLARKPSEEARPIYALEVDVKVDAATRC